MIQIPNSPRIKKNGEQIVLYFNFQCKKTCQRIFFWRNNFQYIHVLHCWVRNFYRAPAGYTADRKTRRKRNMGCYGLLSATSHPLLHLPHLPPSQYSTGNALWTIVYNLWTSQKYTNAGYFLMVFGKSKDDNRIYNIYLSRLHVINASI